MAASNSFLKDKPILYQFKAKFFSFENDKVINLDCEKAGLLVHPAKTFYVIDADPLSSTCLTLFISSPRSNNFKDWHYREKVTPLCILLS